MKGQWHLNNDGEVKKCGATMQCPFENNGGHSNTKDAAIKVAEKFNEKQPYISNLTASHALGLSQTTSDPMEIQLLSKYPDGEVKMNIARNSHTPLNVLSDLAESADYEVREAVAENPHTSAEILKHLSKDESLLVLKAVVQNPNTTTEIFDSFIEGPAPDNESIYNIYYYIPRQKNATPETLTKISKKMLFLMDSHDYTFMENYASIVIDDLLDRKDLPSEALTNIAKFQLDVVDEVDDKIARHPNIDVNVLQEMMKSDNDDVLAAVADSSKATTEMLTKLSKNKEMFVRCAVARNLNTDPKVLAKLYNDKNKTVREWAGKNPRLPMKAMLERAELEAEDD